MTIELHGSVGNAPRSDGRSEPTLLGTNSVGEPVYLFVGTATNDAGVVADVGADANIGDGSLYISAVNASGGLFQKRNDVWTSL